MDVRRKRDKVNMWEWFCTRVENSTVQRGLNLVLATKCTMTLLIFYLNRLCVSGKTSGYLWPQSEGRCHQHSLAEENVVLINSFHKNTPLLPLGRLLRLPCRSPWTTWTSRSPRGQRTPRPCWKKWPRWLPSMTRLLLFSAYCSENHHNPSRC